MRRSEEVTGELSFSKISSAVPSSNEDRMTERTRQAKKRRRLLWPQSS